jgi:hypothetical protein
VVWNFSRCTVARSLLGVRPLDDVTKLLKSYSKPVSNMKRTIHFFLKRASVGIAASIFSAVLLASTARGQSCPAYPIALSAQSLANATPGTVRSPGISAGFHGRAIRMSRH